LLLVHLAGVLLLALPSSHRLGDRNHWQSAKQQQEISGWADRLGVDKDRFESACASCSGAWPVTRIKLPTMS
jgi:hypothetical protein